VKRRCEELTVERRKKTDVKRQTKKNYTLHVWIKGTLSQDLDFVHSVKMPA
jgi:hypothetical protein